MVKFLSITFPLVLLTGCYTSPVQRKFAVLMDYYFSPYVLGRELSLGSTQPGKKKSFQSLAEHLQQWPRGYDFWAQGYASLQSSENQIEALALLKSAIIELGKSDELINDLSIAYFVTWETSRIIDDFLMGFDCYLSLPESSKLRKSSLLKSFQSTEGALCNKLKNPLSTLIEGGIEADEFVLKLAEINDKSPQFINAENRDVFKQLILALKLFSLNEINKASVEIESLDMESNNQLFRGWLWYGKGLGEFLQNKNFEAIQSFEKALANSRPFPTLQAKNLHMLGMSYQAINEFEIAGESYLRASSVFKKIGCAGDSMRALSILVDCYRQQGKKYEAQQVLNQILQIALSSKIDSKAMDVLFKELALKSKNCGAYKAQIFFSKVPRESYGGLGGVGKTRDAIREAISDFEMGNDVQIRIQQFHVDLKKLSGIEKHYVLADLARLEGIVESMKRPLIAVAHFKLAANTYQKIGEKSWVPFCLEAVTNIYLEIGKEQLAAIEAKAGLGWLENEGDKYEPYARSFIGLLLSLERGESWEKYLWFLRKYKKIEVHIDWQPIQGSLVWGILDTPHGLFSIYKFGSLQGLQVKKVSAESVFRQFQKELNCWRSQRAYNLDASVIFDFPDLEDVEGIILVSDSWFQAFPLHLLKIGNSHLFQLAPVRYLFKGVMRNQRSKGAALVWGEGAKKVDVPFNGSISESKDLDPVSLSSSLKNSDLFFYIGHIFEGEQGYFFPLGQNKTFSAKDIQNNEFQNLNLVALIGCSSGNPSPVNNAMAMGYIEGGADTVLCSHWNISSIGANVFLKNFLLEHKRTMLPHVALNRAQVKLLGTPYEKDALGFRVIH